MTTIKPTLYCDVDGVINIAAKKAQGAASKIIFRKLPSVGRHIKPVPLKIQWRESMVANLALLPVNFIWLTTWNEYAVKILEPLTGIQSHSVIDYHMKFKEIGKQTNKYVLLRDHQKAQPTPFIWIDDVATKHYKEEHWEELGVPHLVIRPKRHFGITDDHMSQIDEFILNLETRKS